MRTSTALEDVAPAASADEIETALPASAEEVMAPCQPRGQTVTFTRGHHGVAEIGPARRQAGADLRVALAQIPPPETGSRRTSQALWL
jgi:hypothetical protein